MAVELTSLCKHCLKPAFRLCKPCGTFLGQSAGIRGIAKRAGTEGPTASLTPCRSEAMLRQILEDHSVGAASVPRTLFQRLDLVLGLVMLVILPFAATSQGFEACGELRNPFGPFDYRTATRDVKDNVEHNHFDGSVESLQRGASTPTAIGHDIDYTLRVFPNHPRALLAMSKLSLREKRPKPTGAQYTIDCYFDRALRFQPNDGAVRMVYGFHLLKKGDRDSAVRELQKALELSGEDASIHYNLGLAYFDLGNFEKSLEHAKQAYKLGFDLPGLRNKLKRAGKWRD